MKKTDHNPYETILLISLGRAIRKNRKRMEITQEALALHVGLTDSTISSIERGEQDTPVTVLESIFNYLRMDSLLTFLSRP